MLILDVTRNKFPVLCGYAMGIVAFVFSVAASAAEPKLSVDFYVGAHNPALEDLNNKEFKSPIAGWASIIDSGGVGTRLDLHFDNPLPKLGPSTNTGIEFRWALSSKDQIIVGVGTWESVSRARAFGDFAIQGEEAEVFSERLAKVSYNEFYFGIRSVIAEKPKKYKIYYRATANEMFDIDFREDITFSFLNGPAEGVDKSMILQSQATGLLALQLGSGFEYYVRDWFTLGLEASYLIGLRKARLRDAQSKVSFLSTDNLNIWAPQRVGDSGDLEYLNPNPTDREDYSKIHLNFDGWKVLFRMGFHF